MKYIGMNTEQNWTPGKGADILARTFQLLKHFEGCAPTLWFYYPKTKCLLNLPHIISSISWSNQTIMPLLKRSFTPSLSFDPFVQLIAVLSGPPIVRLQDTLGFREISWHIIVAPNWLNWWCLKCHPRQYCSAVYWSALHCASIHCTELYYNAHHYTSHFPPYNGFK